MKRIKTFILALMLVLVSVISILTDVLNFSITGNLLDAGYWLRAIILNTSAVIVLFLANSIRKDKVKDTHPVYNERKTALRAAYKALGENNLSDEFKKYIDEDNQKEKLRVYTNKLCAKIQRVKNAISRAEHNYNAFRLFRKKAPVDAPKTLHLILLRFKKERLEERYNNAEKYIKYIKVRYLKISYTALFGESEKMSATERDIYFRTAEHNVGIVFKKALFVIIIGSLSLMQIGELIQNFSLFTVYQMCMRIFTIALSMYTGVADADYFVGQHMSDVLLRRLSYVQDFVDSKKIKE